MDEEAQAADGQVVCLAEILEVRNEGCLSSDELLALLVASCEFLNNSGFSNGRTSGGPALGGVFSPDSVFVTRNGTVKIVFMPLKTAPRDYVPPELKRVRDGDPSTVNSLLIGDAQLVWCLGQIASQASAPNFLDVGLFSLLNLMTVEHVASRPTLAKLSQMLRNKIGGVEVPTILVCLYQELMGDIDELIDDKFCDDIRFSSTRSSLSIVSGANPPQLPSRDFHMTEEIGNAFASSENSNKMRDSALIEDYYRPTQFVEERKQEEEDDDKTDVEEEESTAKINAKKQAKIVKKSSEARSRSGSSTAGEEEDDWSNPFSRNYHEREKSPTRADKMEVDQPDVSHVCSPVVPAHQRPNSEPVQVEVHSVHSQFHDKHPANVIISARHQTTPQSVRSNHQQQQKPQAQSTPLSGQDSNALSMSDSIEPFERIELPAEMLPSPLVPRPKQVEEDNESDYMDCVPAPQAVIKNVQQQNFSRQNSLQPSKIQRRSSSRTISNNKSSSSLAIPEFLEKNSMPLIRLRAQSIKKKKVSIHRSENALVLVKLLNGQAVEVNCRTDAYVSNVFDTVAAHLNITEHIFFGLAMLQNSEFFFLDNDQRLEKSAPPAWKNAKRGIGNEVYTLMLRFRYYPKKIEFIKTETTTHNLYLQLRQDMLNGSLRFDATKAMELAAIGLQAEYGDYMDCSKMENGDQGAYFKLANYLPCKFYAAADEDQIGTTARVIEWHSKFKGFGRVEAERLFIQRCQAEIGYGAHYYKVFKIKPSTKNPYYNRYADAHLIAVMPYGIGICREQDTGHRYIATTHEWHMIRTLQFDRKRFLIATIENNIAVDHVFYTEHYTKSSYLVRFAATQHRFMMKMRQWQSTLNRVGKGSSRLTNSLSRSEVGAVDVSFGSEEKDRQHYEQETIDGTIDTGRRRSSANRQQELSMLKEGRLMSDIDTEYIQYCYGSDAMKLTVVLEKHPDQGLGLTLVDGAVNGVKGVYVKSVSSGGDGKRKGLNIGDCLLSINGVSLFNKTRHDAVELVKECDVEVKLGVLRFPSITEVLACNNNSGDGNTSSNGNLSNMNSCSSQLDDSKRRESVDAVSSSLAQQKSSTTSSSTLALSSSGHSKVQDRLNNGHQGSSSRIAALQKRQRAVSDFGAIGDTLPALNSDDLLNVGKARKNKPDGSFSAASQSSSSDEEGGETSSHSQLRRGEYNLPSVSQMYTSNTYSDDEEYGVEDAGRQQQQQVKPSNRQLLGKDDFDTSSYGSGSHRFVKANHNTISSFDSSTLHSMGSQQRSRRQQNDLDWTNDLSDIEDSASDGESAPRFSKGKRKRVLTITINKEGANQSLGFQIRSSSGLSDASVFFFVNQVNSEPAVSANLHVGDIILSINGTSIEGAHFDHQQVVQLLRSTSPGSSAVVLEVERNEPASSEDGQKQLEEEEETVRVVLDKSQSKCIGLSLAKRMGHDGIFIRNIAVGSLAAQEGSLRVGDRIWQIDMENVADESPASMVQKLKDIDGCFEIQVKRARQ